MSFLWIIPDGVFDLLLVPPLSFSFIAWRFSSLTATPQLIEYKKGTGALRHNREAGAKPARSRRCNRGQNLRQTTPTLRVGGRRGK